MVLSEIFILTDTCDQANTRFKQDHLTKRGNGLRSESKTFGAKKNLELQIRFFYPSVFHSRTANDYSPVRKGS